MKFEEEEGRGIHIKDSDITWVCYASHVIGNPLFFPNSEDTEEEVEIEVVLPPRCECGGEATNLPHYDWCPISKNK